MCPDLRRVAALSRQPKKQVGMTLIELMIAMVVGALLLGIAVPSYQAYVMKARRADARGALTTAAQMLERFSTENGSTYPTAVQFAAGFRTTSENLYYTLSINPTATTYTLSAIPAAGTSQVNDPCGTFTLTQTGQRGVSGGSMTAAQCWQ